MADHSAILSLSTEAVANIVLRLTPLDVLSLSLTCRSLYTIVHGRGGALLKKYLELHFDKRYLSWHEDAPCALQGRYLRQDLAKAIMSTTCRICRFSTLPSDPTGVRVGQDGLQRCEDCSTRKIWQLAMDGGLTARQRADALQAAFSKEGLSVSEFLPNDLISSFVSQGGEWLPDVVACL